MNIDLQRLEEFRRGIIGHGQHGADSPIRCVMEWGAYLAGETHSDRPACVDPGVDRLMIRWNDAIPQTSEGDAMRKDVFTAELLLRVLGSRGSDELARKRAWAAADFAVRTLAAESMERAKLDVQAAALRGFGPLVDAASWYAVREQVKGIKSDARREASERWTDAADAAAAADAAVAADADAAAAAAAAADAAADAAAAAAAAFYWRLWASRRSRPAYWTRYNATMLRMVEAMLAAVE